MISNILCILCGIVFATLVKLTIIQYTSMWQYLPFSQIRLFAWRRNLYSQHRNYHLRGTTLCTSKGSWSEALGISASVSMILAMAPLMIHLNYCWAIYKQNLNEYVLCKFWSFQQCGTLYLSPAYMWHLHMYANL